MVKLLQRRPYLPRPLSRRTAQEALQTFVKAALSVMALA
jgi:hypothetical protein